MRKTALAILVAALAYIPIYANAQTSTGTSVAVAVQAQITAAVNDVLGFVQQFTGPDLSLAAADATANNQPQAALCWQTIAKVAPTPIPTGAGLAYLKQRILDLQALSLPLNQNCGSTAPLFLRAYNLAMSQLATFNF